MDTLPKDVVSYIISIATYDVFCEHYAVKYVCYYSGCTDCQKYVNIMCDKLYNFHFDQGSNMTNFILQIRGVNKMFRAIIGDSIEWEKGTRYYRFKPIFFHTLISSRANKNSLFF